MAEAAVTFLLEQVKELVVVYRDLIAGAEEEFMQLSNELSLLKAIVKDLQRPKKYNNLFKELEGQIRVFVYEVEDTIDKLLSSAIQAKANKKPFRKLFNQSHRSNNLAKEIKSMREDKLIPLLSEAKMKYALVNQDESRIMEDQSSNTMKMVVPIRQNRIIGFDDEEATITGYLKEPTTELGVITILGIPGQGKTTLAWKVYQSDEICYHFPIRIWISISQDFRSRDVLLQILKMFAPSRDLSDVSDDELAQLVLLYLESEKFLLVLDDLWSVEAWDEIKELLPMHNGMGKVLITSGENSFRFISSASRPPHELKFLDRDESWTLLQLEVFGNLEECPPALEGIGASIARKCEGVPLTLVVIGGILVELLCRSPSPSMAKDGWEKVLKFGMDTLQSDRAQCIIDVVDLSYKRLPDRLKECFLYLGVFPQDYEIPTKTLSRLWISEGFIPPEPRMSLEERAQEILTDLIFRNLLKVERTNGMGEPKTCRVHKLIHAFCTAKSKEESLFQEVKRSRTGALEPPMSELHKSFRLCLHSDLSMFLSKKPPIPHVRSFLCFYERPVEVELKYTSAIPDAFPKLRILESSSIRFASFPENVTELIHLRYLTLYIGNLPTLPATIAQLWNLQALVVETRSRSITMKANLWKMVRLRHLNTNAAIVFDGNWEGEAGHNLQTLHRLSPKSCTEAVSRKAVDLKTLGISGKLDNFFEAGFLEKLLRLENLKLANTGGYEDEETGISKQLHRLPKQNCFPPTLKRLTMANTRLGWEHMSTLAMIKSLESLKIKDNAFVGATWRASGYNFPSLQLLLMAETDLILWEASNDSFPTLWFVVVRNCDSLKEIPGCLGTHLRRLEINRVRSSVVNSAKKIAETKNMEKAAARFGVPFKLVVGPACMRD